MKIRIDKFLSNMGKGSRREIKTDIRRGRVKVNGCVVASGSISVDTRRDVVEYGEGVVSYIPFVYLMLNKPSGFVSATKDNLHPVVTDLVPEEYAHYDVFPAGRLDMDTTGLLILTNDGDFAHELLSPARQIPKTYHAVLDADLTASERESLLRGVSVETKKGVHFCTARHVEIRESFVSLTVTEGKFHQVKKMFEAVGRRVLKLRRVSIGMLFLDETLNPGEIRELTEDEKTAVRQPLV